MLESVHLFLHLNLVYHQCIIKTGLALGNGKKEKIYYDIADQSLQSQIKKIVYFCDFSIFVYPMDQSSINVFVCSSG